MRALPTSAPATHLGPGGYRSFADPQVSTSPSPVACGCEVRGCSGLALTCAREPDADLEPAVRARLDLERGVMGVRDRRDDRQPEAEALAMADPVAGEALERLKQPIDLLGGNHRPGVGDREIDLARPGAHRHPRVSARIVVAKRVVDQVRHEPLDQAPVARDRRGLERDARRARRERPPPPRAPRAPRRRPPPGRSARARRSRAVPAPEPGARRSAAPAGRSPRAPAGTSCGTSRRSPWGR